jgi:hypothetical protein
MPSALNSNAGGLSTASVDHAGKFSVSQSPLRLTVSSPTKRVVK